MATQEVENARLFGIAKKIDAELNELPEVEHATLITVLNAFLQKRNMARQRAQHEEQQQLQREAQFGARGPVALVPQ